MNKNWNKLIATVFALACWEYVGAQELVCVARNDCGVEGKQPFLVKGENQTCPEGVKGTVEARTYNYGNTVIYAFNQLDINAAYRLEVVYLSEADSKQRIVADGNEVQAPVRLEKGKEQRYRIDLPKKAYAYGQLVLLFEAVEGSKAIVSELNLYSSNATEPVPFEKDKRLDLVRTQSFQIDTSVCVESVLPTYIQKPAQVSGVYQPILSLNGVWKFNERPSEDFFKSEVGGEDWKQIVVPGQWAMQGFKVDSAAFGGYQTTFELPEDWLGKQVKLRFDGVSSESVVYLNGQEVGGHLGGMTPFELDITSSLRRGKNLLSLRVRNESLADMLGSLTQYAAHQLGGITRKVTLMAVPQVHISDLRIVTDLDKAYEDAELKVFVSVTNASAVKQEHVGLRLSVDGLPTLLYADLPQLEAGETWSGWLKGVVDSPKKWDSEHPHLYTMRLTLSAQKKSIEQVEKRFGFREVFVDGNRLLVNGKAVKLRGVCRHEAHPLTGRVMHPDLVRKDVTLYRDANCNFIRTSHYPPCEELIDVCDELGMFVELEAPVCWIGHHANENWKALNYRDTLYYGYVLQANMETIHFYRNHPSVLFWSMANESYWNQGFAQVEAYVRKADPSRPYTFHDQAYGGFNNQGSTAPIANIHYPGPNGYKVAAKSERPMVYGEYCHLNVYNRSELVTDPGIRSDWALALAPTWENMYKTPGVLGGSIWSGIDDIFQMPNGDAVGYGPWGPVDGWRRPKPEYWDMKKVYSPVRVHTKSLQPSSRFDLLVENRYTFTNLNELKIRWKYGDKEGVASLDCMPGDSTVLSIAASESGQEAGGLYLSFEDPKGFMADEFLIPVGEQRQNRWPEPEPMKTSLKEKSDRFVIKGRDFSCEVDRLSGQILSVRKQGKEMINGGPWLMALPLTGGGCYPNHNANTPIFNSICSEWKVSRTSARQDGESVAVTVEGSYKEFDGHYTLHVNASGAIRVSYAFRALADLNPRQWGLVFEAPDSFDRTYWRRDGLWSVYPQDHISRPTGKADLFYEALPESVDPRVEPSWSWSYDFNELGSNDFRATRRNIWYAGLEDGAGANVTALSDGKQHWRSWLERERIRFLIADFVTPGDELFLGSYYQPYRKPLKKGDRIEGEVKLLVGHE